MVDLGGSAESGEVRNGVCVCFQVLSCLRRVTLRSCKAGINHGLEQERVGLVMSGACLSRVDRSVKLKAWHGYYRST